VVGVVSTISLVTPATRPATTSMVAPGGSTCGISAARKEA
jgi:hypothetical protein